MRPSDENQRGSKRPNLMSSSRRAAGGDDKILAKLERGTAAGAAGKPARPTLRWLGAGGSIIVALIGTLTWVAYVNATTPRVLPVARIKPYILPNATQAPRPMMLARADGAAIDAPVPAGPAPAVVTTPVPLPVTVAAPATILDEAPEPDTAAPAAVERPRAAARPVERHVVPTRHAIAPYKLLPQRSARATAARAAAPRQASYTARRPAKGVRNAAVRGHAKGAQATPPAQAEPALDSDVALLSALVAHSGKHAAERAQQDTHAAPACGAGADSGKKCPVKASALLEILRKTTD